MQLRKGRTVKDDKWGMKKYISELGFDTAREVMKTRLHMMPIPCNYGGSSDGCGLCGVMEKIETEHYLRCRGTEYLRKKWNVKEDNLIRTMDTCLLINMGKYLRQVTVFTNKIRE